MHYTFAVSANLNSLPAPCDIHDQWLQKLRYEAGAPTLASKMKLRELSVPFALYYMHLYKELVEHYNGDGGPVDPHAPAWRRLHRYAWHVAGSANALYAVLSELRNGSELQASAQRLNDYILVTVGNFLREVMRAAVVTQAEGWAARTFAQTDPGRVVVVDANTGVSAAPGGQDVGGVDESGVEQGNDDGESPGEGTAGAADSHGRERASNRVLEQRGDDPSFEKMDQPK